MPISAWFGFYFQKAVEGYLTLLWQSREKPVQGETLQEDLQHISSDTHSSVQLCLEWCELVPLRNRQLWGAQLNNKGSKFNLCCSPPTVKILNLWVKLRNLMQQSMAQNGHYQLWFLSCNLKVCLRSYLLFALTQFIFSNILVQIMFGKLEAFSKQPKSLQKLTE